jgi:hypothetical protein
MLPPYEKDRLIPESAFSRLSPPRSRARFERRWRMRMKSPSPQQIELPGGTELSTPLCY